MKRLNIISIILSVMAIIITSCNDGPQYNDVIYVTGTESQATTSLLLDGNSASMGITVTSTDKLDKDAKVTLKVAPEMLDAYNKKYDRKYKMLPEGSYKFENPDVIIKGGQNISSQAELCITSTDKFENGVTYCVPVMISESKGMNVLEASRTAFIVINHVLRTKAAVLNGTYYSVPSFIKNPNVASLPQLTLECKFYVNQFQNSNPFISSLMGIEEDFLLRFGDVSCGPDQLQLAGGKTGVPDGNPDHGTAHPMTLPTHFATGKWYHLALVYNGVAIKIYVNGVEISSTSANGPVCLSWDYQNGFHIGMSCGGRYLNGYISEARIWSKALTVGDIQSNVCYVDPISDGLLAYWRFNGADINGTTVKDLTGHGYDAVASGTPQWVDNQPCPF